MRTRDAIAVVGLGLGLLAWSAALAVRTVREWPAPGYVAKTEQFDRAMAKLKESGRLPATGVVGYRDEIHGPWETDPNTSLTHTLCQFGAAPVILDRTGSHETVFVVVKDGVRIVRVGGGP